MREEILVNGKTVTLVSTAHVSHQSAELVEDTIRELHPDAVCIELCQSRYDAIRDPERWKKTDIFEIIKSGRGYVLLTQLVLAAFQQRIAKQLNIRPGEEMLRAIAVGEELGIPIILIDREIKITLKRAWAGAGLWTLCKISGTMLGALFSHEEISEEEIEKLKSNDVLTVVLDEFAEILPSVKTSLIDERDIYMSHKIMAAPHSKVVAVIGAGHGPGIKRNLDGEHDIASLETVPPAKLGRRILGLLIPALVVGLVIAVSAVSGRNEGGQVLLEWALITGGFSALTTLCALPHPASVLVAFLAAPLTTLHPALAVGWFSGMTEAYFKKPQVSDLQTVASDVTTLGGWRHNRVTKILLVMVFSNLGAAIGAVLGAGTLISKLF